MEIKSEDAVLLFQKRSTKIFSSFSKSKFIEIEQEFQQLNDTLVQVKAEIEDPKDPDGLGFNINIKTENVEPISNNYNVCKRQAQLFRHQHYVQNICPVCRKRFSSFGKRKKHFMTHFYLPSSFKTKKNCFGRCLFICIFCGEICILKHEIAIHCFSHKTKKLTKLTQNSLYCSNKIIPLLRKIKNEVDIEYNNFTIKQEPQKSVPIRVPKCEVCLRQFKSEASLNRHLTYHKKNHTCRICLKICKSAYGLKRHQISHSSLKLFKCDFCSKYFKSKNSLNVHKSLNCLKKYCLKRYFSKTALHSHSCNPKSIDCTDCGKLVSPKSNLNVHLDTHTEMRPYKCKLCPKMFKYPQDLKRHLLYHSGEKPFECNICQKRFRLKQHLTRHMYCHNDEKPFKCEICFKTFTQKYGLVYHFRRHTSDTPFKCNICSNAYTEKKMLDYHVLSHTGDKPFVCAVCSKRFKQKQDLKRHSHIHTGNKSFICAICGKCFARKEYLNDHLRTHTGEKPYQCNICLKRFSFRRSLSLHMPRHIKEKSG